MHDPEGHGELVEHGGERASDRAFLRPDLDLTRLKLPVVLSISLRGKFQPLFDVRPGQYTLGLAGLIGEPFPWDRATLTRLRENPT